MKNILKRLWSCWNIFWFAPKDLLGLASTRVVLMAVMVYMYALRLYNLDYYSDLSWIPRAKALIIFPEIIRPAFAWFFWPDSMNLIMHAVLVLFLILLLLGIGGRWLMTMAWVINMGFLQRNFAINFGADILCAVMMFYLCFIQSCERLSVLNVFRKKKVFRSSDLVTSTMIRMMQIQLCVIYTYTGFEKLKGSSWWDGTALWNVIANPQMMAFDMSFMRNFPTFIGVMSFATLLFEIYFTPAVMFPKTRPWIFLIGLGFHLGIAFLMALMPFSAAMISGYFLFMNPLEMRQWVVSMWESFRKAFSSEPIKS